jgi:outer membrane translocation and assembly module TamA
LRILAWIPALAVAGGCASIPKERYGVSSVELQGVEQVDGQTLRACLATRERPWFEFNLGRSASPDCGSPPFDAARLRLQLWRWPWADWPLYDKALFERDLERIERWYRARGFYDAKVTSTRFEPTAAANSDRLESEDPPCEREDDDEGCTVDIEIEVQEGAPVYVESIELEGNEKLPRSLQEQLRNALVLSAGDRFDEALYDQSKEVLAERLREASYACAEVEGTVKIDPEARNARIVFDLNPGQSAVFGPVQVVGNEDLPVKPILGAAFLKAGDRYSESALDDAQRAIYGLGTFSSVQVEPQIPNAGCGRPIPVKIEVSPGRRYRIGLGGGLQSGILQRGGEQTDVQQWDVHLLLPLFEHRNLFGGMRRFRFELRPRLIFNDVFPNPTEPTFGGQVVTEFRQPAFLEPRTTLVVSARYDGSPDPFGNRFFGHIVDARINLERNFLDGNVFLSGGLHGNVLRTQRVSVEAIGGSREYHLMFWEQYAQLDLRDDPRRTTRGAFFALGLQEAGFGLPASWDYIRATPEARGYVPLPLGLVVAVRVGLGAMFILNADQDLDIPSRELGPEQYRLRGGGASSNRGFVAGTLGERGILGGRRKWETSLELRVPVTEDFGIVAFGDVGDVSAGNTFRFNHLNLSVGGGLRYQTIVGPVRLDLAGRVPGAQAIGARPDDSRFELDLGFVRFPGAFHLTIGESF